MTLSRYHRQELLPGFGAGSSALLAQGHAMIVGCGALGTVAAEMLARAGVGRLTLIDRDVVELTNLQRQTLYDERDAREARPKAEAAKRRLGEINSSIVVDALVEDFAGPEAERIAASYPRPGVLLDCSDNFATRYLCNDLAVKLTVPLCYAGAVGTGGVQMTIVPGATACLRCVFPDAPAPGASPTCDTAGVLASVTTIVASRQATDAMKILLGRGDLVDRAVFSVDPWHNLQRRLDTTHAKRADCRCCGAEALIPAGESRFELLDARHDGATVLCGRNSVQIMPRRTSGEAQTGLAALAARLSPLGACERGERTVRFRPPVPSGYEITLFDDGRAVVTGTTDPAAARAIFDRYVGS